LTRQWLDFAWIERTGPTAVNWAALGPALLGAAVAGGCFGIVWRSPRWGRAWPALAIATLVLAGGVYRSLRVYDAQVDPTIDGIARAVASAPDGSAIVQLLPENVAPFANWQRRALPELCRIEGPR